MGIVGNILLANTLLQFWNQGLVSEFHLDIKNIIKSMEQSIKEYTINEVLEEKTEQTKEMSLECLFGQVDKKITLEQREEFYSDCLDTILKTLDLFAIRGEFIFRIETTPKENINYPMVELNDKYHKTLVTTEELSNKTNVLWLYDRMKEFSNEEQEKVHKKERIEQKK